MNANDPITDLFGDPEAPITGEAGLDAPVGAEEFVLDEEPQQEDGPEVIEEDFQVTLSVRDVQDQDVELNLGQEDLTKYVQKGYLFDTLMEHSQSIAKQLEQSRHVAQVVAQDQLLSATFQMIASGLPHQEVVARLSQALGIGAQQQQEEDDGLDAVVDPDLKKFLAKQTEPLRKQQEELLRRQQEEADLRQRQQVVSENNVRFSQAIAAEGVEYNPGSKEHQQRLYQALRTLYPNADDRTLFTAEQARAVIRMAGLPTKAQQQQSAPNTKPAARPNAPRLVRTKAGAATKTSPKNVEYVPAAKRGDAFAKLFNL